MSAAPRDPGRNRNGSRSGASGAARGSRATRPGTGTPGRKPGPASGSATAPARKRAASGTPRAGRKPAPRLTRARKLGLAIATAFALAGLLLLLLVLAPDLQARHQWLAMAASFAPYGWLSWLVAVLVGVAATRQRVWVLPLTLGLLAHSFVLAPYLPAANRAVAAPQATLSVLELNLHFGLADLSQLAARIDRDVPDVVVLVEVTRSALKVLDGKAWRERLPHRLGTAGWDVDPATGNGDSSGTMILSRHPLTELERASGMTFTNLTARVELPDHPFVLLGAHPVNPEHGLNRWLQDGQALAQLASRHAGEPLVVAGDLNATAEHLPLRELNVRAGLTDSAAGRGWLPTYPSGAWYPPLIQIDHVLVSEVFITTSVETFAVAGTDHRGLLVRLALP